MRSFIFTVIITAAYVMISFRVLTWTRTPWPCDHGSFPPPVWPAAGGPREGYRFEWRGVIALDNLFLLELVGTGDLLRVFILVFNFFRNGEPSTSALILKDDCDDEGLRLRSSSGNITLPGFTLMTAISSVELASLTSLPVRALFSSYIIISARLFLPLVFGGSEGRVVCHSYGHCLLVV